MKHLALIVVLGLYLCPLANASMICGDYYLSDGRKVDLSGLEWLSIAETRGLRYEQLSTYLSSGYRLATEQEVEALFTSIMGDGSGYMPLLGTGYDGFNASDFTGASWFINIFGVTECAWNYGVLYYTSFNYEASGGSMLGGTVMSNTFNEEYRNLFPNDLGLISLDENYQEGYPWKGWLLVKNTPVPEPRTVLLFGTGVACLAAVRWRRK
nr:PEP-CTERM sorting domain-containing protein [uncultured Desulfobulbus sp.]